MQDTEQFRLQEEIASGNPFPLVLHCTAAVGRQEVGMFSIVFSPQLVYALLYTEQENVMDNAAGYSR